MGGDEPTNVMLALQCSFRGALACVWLWLCVCVCVLRVLCVVCVRCVCCVCCVMRNSSCSKVTTAHGTPLPCLLGSTHARSGL